jgi:hypothetical protein
MKNKKLSSIFVLSIISHGAHASSIWSRGVPETLSQENIARIEYAMSLARPHCPHNGEAIPDCSGIVFNGTVYYFGQMSQKREIVTALTGQSDDLGQDVIKNSIITRKDFDNPEVTQQENEGFPFYFLKFREGHPPLKLSSSAFVIIIKEQGKALGLSDEEILAKINSFRTPQTN